MNSRTFRLIYDVPGGSLTLGPPHVEDVTCFGAQLGSDNAGDVGLATVSIWDHKEQNNAQWLHVGLRALMEIDGADVFSASDEAAGRLHLLLTAASLHSGESIGEIRLLLGLDITPGNTTTEFIQAHYLNPFDPGIAVFHRKRQVDVSGFVDTLRLAVGQGNERLTRATIWHRLAMSSDDPIVRFISVWTGLENLNPPLKDRLGAAPEYGTCKSCGAPYELASAFGVRALFLKYSPGGDADWKKCRNFRVDLLHGHGSMANANTSADECTALCAPLLRTGIYLCLGEDPATLDTRPAPPSGRDRIFLQLQGEYDLAPESLPRVPLLKIGPVRVTRVDRNGYRNLVVRPELSSPYPLVECCAVALHANGEFARQPDIEVTATDVSVGR